MFRPTPVDTCISDRALLVKIDLKEAGVGKSEEWIQLPLDRDKTWNLMNTVMNLMFSQDMGNFLTS
jgi:hypothetical protein